MRNRDIKEVAIAIAGVVVILAFALGIGAWLQMFTRSFD